MVPIPVWTASVMILGPKACGKHQLLLLVSKTMCKADGSSSATGFWDIELDENTIFTVSEWADSHKMV